MVSDLDIAPPAPWLVHATNQYANSPATSIKSNISSSASSVFSIDAPSTQSSASSVSGSWAAPVWNNGNQDPNQSATTTNPTNLKENIAPRAYKSSNLCQASECIKVVDPEARQNPRRTQRLWSQDSQDGSNTTPCPRPPPTLVRQSERKVNFVDSLVDTTTQMVETIWPLSAHKQSGQPGPCSRQPSKMELRYFIQEVLKRSKTSYSTLQVALYYLVLVQPHVPKLDFTQEQPEDCPASFSLQCGRRMFIAALILASKYLQDRNFSANAWSKISGLSTWDLNVNEMAFVSTIGWKLHIPERVFHRWTDIVLQYSPSSNVCGAQRSVPRPKFTWKEVVLRLTPNLDAIDIVGADLSDDSGYDSPGSPASVMSPPSIPASDILMPESEPTPRPSNSVPQWLKQTPRVDSPIHQVEHNTMLPPTQPRPALLPTPKLTPQNDPYCTPAAGMSRSFSKCSSMSQIVGHMNEASLSRCTLDRTSEWRPKVPEFDPPTRRTSLGTSASSLSSPAAMSETSTAYSNASSRLSRSSSISSVESSTCAPAPPTKLAVQATRRCAKMQLNGVKQRAQPICLSPTEFRSPVTAGDNTPTRRECTPLARKENQRPTFQKAKPAFYDGGASPPFPKSKPMFYDDASSPPPTKCKPRFYDGADSPPPPRKSRAISYDGANSPMESASSPEDIDAAMTLEDISADRHSSQSSLESRRASQSTVLPSRPGNVQSSASQFSAQSRVPYGIVLSSRSGNAQPDSRRSSLQSQPASQGTPLSSRSGNVQSGASQFSDQTRALLNSSISSHSGNYHLLARRSPWQSQPASQSTPHSSRSGNVQPTSSQYSLQSRADNSGPLSSRSDNARPSRYRSIQSHSGSEFMPLAERLSLRQGNVERNQPSSGLRSDPFVHDSRSSTESRSSSTANQGAAQSGGKPPASRKRPYSVGSGRVVQNDASEEEIWNHFSIRPYPGSRVVPDDMAATSQFLQLEHRNTVNMAQRHIQDRAVPPMDPIPTRATDMSNENTPMRARKKPRANPTRSQAPANAQQTGQLAFQPRHTPALTSEEHHLTPAEHRSNLPAQPYRPMEPHLTNSPISPDWPYQGPTGYATPHASPPMRPGFSPSLQASNPPALSRGGPLPSHALRSHPDLIYGQVNASPYLIATPNTVFQSQLYQGRARSNASPYSEATPDAVSDFSRYQRNSVPSTRNASAASDFPPYQRRGFSTASPDLGATLYADPDLPTRQYLASSSRRASAASNSQSGQRVAPPAPSRSMGSQPPTTTTAVPQQQLLGALNRATDTAAVSANQRRLSSGRREWSDSPGLTCSEDDRSGEETIDDGEDY